jgi:IclR family transcriptional regulator, positive regulator for flagellar biogenesis
MPPRPKPPQSARSLNRRTTDPRTRGRTDSAAESDAGQVRVLARGLSILRAFTPRNEWLSNQDIAARTSLPRPTVSRLTANLTGLRYLSYSTELRKYRLGTSVLALGFGALANLDIRVLARPLLQQLADQEDALVVLASRDGMVMVCNEVCHSTKSIFTLRVNVGSRLVLPYSAMGQALLGAMTPEERNEALRQISRDFKKNWGGLQKLLEDAVDQYRRCGYCTTFETLESGINGISVAVDTPGAPHSFTLGLAGPSFRFPADRLEADLGPKLLAIRRNLETRVAELMPGTSDLR